ncbi:MAG: MAPEG family protein [Sphingobium sp.]
MTVTIASSLLAPAAALVVWSLVMLVWLVIVRGIAFRAAQIDLRKVPAGGRGQDLDRMLPAPANWPAHNYAHLMEQPTLFYATVILLALLGQGSMLNIALAWGYVAVRIVHSFWQARVNIVAVRAPLFLLSSLMLMILAVNALIAALSLA